MGKRHPSPNTKLQSCNADKWIGWTAGQQDPSDGGDQNIGTRRVGNRILVKHFRVGRGLSQVTFLLFLEERPISLRTQFQVHNGHDEMPGSQRKQCGFEKATGMRDFIMKAVSSGQGNGYMLGGSENVPQTPGSCCGILAARLSPLWQFLKVIPSPSLVCLEMRDCLHLITDADSDGDAVQSNFACSHEALRLLFERLEVARCGAQGSLGRAPVRFRGPLGRPGPTY